MLAGVLSRVGWFKATVQRGLANQPTGKTLLSHTSARFLRVPNAFSPLHFEGLSAAERFRRCRASVERRCKARALVAQGSRIFSPISRLSRRAVLPELQCPRR